VPEHKIVDIAGRSVLLVKRFDRGPAGERVGYMSAGTLVGAEPTTIATSVTYADIAAAARAPAAAPTAAADRLIRNLRRFMGSPRQR
jgi:serine/threonine-protein kinase HipA